MYTGVSSTSRFSVRRMYAYFNFQKKKFAAAWSISKIIHSHIPYIVLQNLKKLKNYLGYLSTAWVQKETDTSILVLFLKLIFCLWLPLFGIPSKTK
jgi:hypothetical protein